MPASSVKGFVTNALFVSCGFDSTKIELPSGRSMINDLFSHLYCKLIIEACTCK